MIRPLPVLALTALFASAADKPNPTVHAENQEIAISATLINDRDAIKQEVGSDLDGYFTLVKVEVTPKEKKPLAVSRDDFLLHSNKDGQRSQPFAPSQIAGRGTLIVSQTGRASVGSDRGGGPVIGGWPGGGRPTRLPGNQPGIGTTGDPESAQAKVDTGGKSTGDSPLLTTLKQRVFPDKQASGPVSGLLYFQLEGKHKPKNLSLYYRGPAGKLTLSFRP